MSYLTDLRDEWNGLVDTARAAGVSVRPWAMTPTTADYGRCRVEWLRARIAASNGHAAPLPAAPLPRVTTDRPMPDYTYGVEFEFILPLAGGTPTLTRADIAMRLTHAGIACHSTHYGHTTPTNWKIVTDSTVGMNGGELVSPILTGESGIAAMRTACEVMVAAGCTINRTCGFHVHVGVRDTRPRIGTPSFFRNLVRLYGHYEGSLDMVMAMSRRGHANNYCSPIGATGHLDRVTTTRSIISSFRSGNRYTKVNLAAYWRHGTVEFRHHGGTIEADKAENWVRLCLRMVARAKAGFPALTDASLDSLLATVDATASERTFFEGRREHFARREGRTLPTAAPVAAVTPIPVAVVPATATPATGLNVAPTTLPFSEWMRSTHPEVMFYDVRRNPR